MGPEVIRIFVDDEIYSPVASLWVVSSTPREIKYSPSYFCYFWCLELLAVIVAGVIYEETEITDSLINLTSFGYSSRGIGWE